MTESIPRTNFKADDLVKAGRTTSYNIDAMQDWLLHQVPAIPTMSDEQVALFLIACKNDVEATKNCILCFFKYKADAPEMFADRDIDSDELRLTQKVTSMAIIPHRTKENYTVVLAGLKDTSYSNFYLDSQTKLLYLCLDQILYENPPDGVIVIINIKGVDHGIEIVSLNLIKAARASLLAQRRRNNDVGLMHLTRLKPSTVKKFFSFLQEALPTQLKQIHIFNTTYIFDKIIYILKPFMNKELFDMIVTHPPNMNTDEFFEKHIPADLIPSDFGGNLPNLEQLSEERRQMARNMAHYLQALDAQIEIYKERKN